MQNQDRQTKKQEAKREDEGDQAGVYGTDANKQGHWKRKGKLLLRQESCRMPHKLEAS